MSANNKASRKILDKPQQKTQPEEQKVVTDYLQILLKVRIKDGKPYIDIETDLSTPLPTVLHSVSQIKESLFKMVEGKTSDELFRMTMRDLATISKPE